MAPMLLFMFEARHRLHDSQWLVHRSQEQIKLTSSEISVVTLQFKSTQTEIAYRYSVSSGLTVTKKREKKSRIFKAALMSRFDHDGRKFMIMTLCRSEAT